MTLLFLLLAVIATQIHVVADQWLGPAAPDPTVVLAAFAGLYWPRHGVMFAALVLGWGRAVVLVEPAGGQVLCALVALGVVASQREGLDDRGWTAFVWSALLVAAAWAGTGWLAGHVLEIPPKAGRELFLGAVLALPFAGLARGMARLSGLAAS